MRYRLTYCLQDISVDHIQGYTPAVNSSLDEEQEEDKENSSENIQQEGGPKKKRKQEKEYANETAYFDERKNVVHVFEPHVKPIYSLQIKAFEPCKVYSSSYDGVVRCLDLQHKQCVELYREEDKRNDGLTYIDIACDNTVMYIGNSYGSVVAYDQRDKSAEAISYDVHDRKVTHLCCHPNTAHLFATSSLDKTVKIWDSRKLDNKKLEPLCTATHGQSVTSVDWSPSGNKILTTSLDDTCRVYSYKNSKVDQKKYVSVAHNNHTGRWISAFRATVSSK